MRQRLLSVEGGQVWVGSLEGSGPGWPLLVTHGGPGFLCLTEGLEELAAQRSVHFYDQLGCGRSERPRDVALWTVERYAREFDSVRRQLGGGPLHILGQSWGTMLAVEALLRHGQEGVASLILAGPFLSTPLWEADQRRHLGGLTPAQQEAVARAEASGDFDGPAYQEAMMAFYQRHVCRLDPWPQALQDALGQMNTQVYLTMWGPSEFTTTGTLKGADLTPRLRELEVPVLLLAGEHDEAGLETCQHYRDLLPRGELAVLPNASHLHQFEQPALMRAVINEFLTRVEARAGAGEPRRVP